MQVSVVSEAGLERRIKVSLPAERVEQAVQARIKRIGSQVRVPGFRPGKAPQAVLVQRYGDQAREEAVGELIRSSYPEALQQSKLVPAGMPNIEMEAAPLAGQGLEYTAVFDVYPEIMLGKLGEIAVTRPQVEIVDADIDRVISSLREQHKTYAAADRKAEQGDRVTMDFEGKLDGEVFEGGSAKGFELVLGSGRLLPDMENALPGHAAGETFTVPVNFPADYGAEHLRGKTAQFSITLNKVEAGQLPELTDEFIAKVGVAEGGVAALRDKIRASLQRQAEQTIKNRVKVQAFDQLRSHHEIAAPRGLVGEEIERMRRESLGRLPPRLRRDFEKDPGKLAQLLPDENFREAAAKRVTLGLLVAEFVKQRSLKVDAGLVQEALDALAADYERPQEVVQHYRSNPRMMQGLEATVLEDQVVTALLAGGKVDTKSMSFEQLVKPEHGEPGHVHGPDCDHD